MWPSFVVRIYHLAEVGRVTDKSVVVLFLRRL